MNPATQRRPFRLHEFMDGSFAYLDADGCPLLPEEIVDLLNASPSNSPPLTPSAIASLTDDEIVAAWNGAKETRPDAGHPDMYLHYMRAVAKAQREKMSPSSTPCTESDLLPGLREALLWKPNTPQLENAMSYAWEQALKSRVRAIEAGYPGASTPSAIALSEPTAWAIFAADTHEMIDLSLIKPDEGDSAIYGEPLFLNATVIDPRVMDLVREHGATMTNSEIVQKFLPLERLASPSSIATPSIVGTVPSDESDEEFARQVENMDRDTAEGDPVQVKDGDTTVRQDLFATIEKLVREGGRKYPCFDEDEFLDAVRAALVPSMVSKPGKIFRFGAERYEGDKAIYEVCVRAADYDALQARYSNELTKLESKPVQLERELAEEREARREVDKDNMRLRALSPSATNTSEFEAFADQLDNLNRLYSGGLTTAVRIAARLREIARNG